MQKMLVLINHIDIERHIPEIKEIAKTHSIDKTYLANVSSGFGPRVRSIVSPHKLNMIAEMSDIATGKYLSQIQDSLRQKGMDSEIVDTSIPANRLENFIKNNNINLVLSSDGRSGLCRWHSGSLAGRNAQFLYDHTLVTERVESMRSRSTTSDVKKMLVLMSRLDIEEYLPQLRDIAVAQGVKSVHLASVLSPSGSDSPGMVDNQELHPVERVVVYLVRVSRAFGSRVRSRVSPQKLDMAVKISDDATNKYLLKVANALAAWGIDAIPIGVSIPAEKIEEYIGKNNINLVVTGDGRSGLYSWSSEGLTKENLPSVYEKAFAEEVFPVEPIKDKTRQGIRTLPAIVLQFTTLFLFWIALSGNYHLEYVLFGLASAALVTYFTNELVFSSSNPNRLERVIPSITQFWRFLVYLPKLFIRIVLANLQVAYLVLHPKMPISPAILRFQTHIKRDVAQVLLANSITLTPGTVTVDLKDGEYIVHALVPLSAYELITGQFQNRVGAIWGERWEEPETSWHLSVNEVGK